MTAIERTAYPHFKHSFTEDELAQFYSPTEADLAFVENLADDEAQGWTMMLLLKAFQKLGRLPKLSDVPTPVSKHIAGQMQIPWPERLPALPRMTRSRYRQAIYGYLDVKAYRHGAAKQLKKSFSNQLKR